MGSEGKKTSIATIAGALLSKGKIVKVVIAKMVNGGF